MNTSGSNRWSCPSSDSEFYSVSSPETISPAPSVDRSFSPAHRLESADPPASLRGATERKRRPRLKNPSEQRQNASEKEKLRMRDLTKALHHLRTFLPPSVAPAGQTLTKIETLRLTIGYISFLSAQLGLSEEELTYRRQSPCSPDILGYFQYRSGDGQWSERGQGYGHLDQGGDVSGHAGQCVDMNVEQNIHQSQQCAQTTQTYPVYGRNFSCHLVPQAYWS